MEKKLYRSRMNKMVFGVCGGIAEYFELDPTIVRLGTVLISIFSAGVPVLLIYILAGIIMPEAPAN